jgi:hypothetical protein
MIGKGSILYDVTAGETIAPVSAIGRLDLERSEIETTTHGPRERRTHRVGLKRDAPVTVRLNYRPNDEPVVRLLERYEAGESAEYALIFPDHSAYAFEAFVSALGQETPRDGLIHRSFRFLPTGVTEPRLSAIAFCGTYYDYSQWSAPGDDYPAAPAGVCPVQFDISKWYT